MPHNIVFSKETMMPHMTLYLGFIFFLFSFFWGEGNTDTLLLHCIWWGGNDTFINAQTLAKATLRFGICI